MCKFCESLIDDEKEILWNVRSTYADDNIDEILSEFLNNQGLFNKYPKTKFKIKGYEHNNNVYVGIEFSQEYKVSNGSEIIINPFSETIQFNFCPICGKQISKDILKFEKYYDNQIEISDID